MLIILFKEIPNSFDTILNGFILGLDIRVLSSPIIIGNKAAIPSLDKVLFALLNLTFEFLYFYNDNCIKLYPIKNVMSLIFIF